MRILLCTYVLNVLNEALDRLPAARYHHSDRAEQEDACKRVDQQ